MERSLLKKLKAIVPEEHKTQKQMYVQEEKVPKDSGPVMIQSKNLTKNNEMVSLLKLESNLAVPQHGHDFIEVFYTCKGTVQHIVQGNTVSVNAGDLLFMNQNAVHEICPISENDVVIYLVIVPEFFHQIYSMMETENTIAEFIFNSLFCKDKKISYLNFQTNSNRRILNLMENMIEILLGGRQNNVKLLQTTMFLIFLELIENFEQEYKNEMKPSYGGNIMAVIKYIEQNYQEASLTELSKQMNISVAYLSQMIRKNTGDTFKKLLQNRRFQVAAELMCSSDIPINDIAEKVGYENISYFYKKFAERYQMTPSEYRKQNKNKDIKDEADRISLQNKLNIYWSERSESYSEQNRKQLDDEHRESWKKLILTHASKKKNLKILDIGTGPGFVAILLAQCGYEVVAVDRNSDMLSQAEVNAKRYSVDVKFMKVGDELPFSDNRFDLVISRDVTWLQLQPEKVFWHWYQKVVTGGKLLYFDANWYGYLKDEEERKKYKAFRKFVKERNGFVYSKAREMERMAGKLPLTYEERPRWDTAYWKRNRVKNVYHISELNSDIYTEMEQLQYLKTPEFLVVVEK
jgi:AraC-like DNA-binding protein/quercetin dioxygenase-like cupin family protein/trans-aconitate methyltransferase